MFALRRNPGIRDTAPCRDNSKSSAKITTEAVSFTSPTGLRLASRQMSMAVHESSAFGSRPCVRLRFAKSSKYSSMSPERVKRSFSLVECLIFIATGCSRNVLLPLQVVRDRIQAASGLGFGCLSQPTIGSKLPPIGLSLGFKPTSASGILSRFFERPERALSCRPQPQSSLCRSHNRARNCDVHAQNFPSDWRTERGGCRTSARSPGTGDAQFICAANPVRCRA